MLQCLGCGLEFSSPLRAPPVAWYKLLYQTLDLYPSNRWEFAEVLRRLDPSDVVYEIGCGSGAFLELCKARGLSATGIDFAEDAVEVCRTKGLRAQMADIKSVRAPDCSRRPTQIVAFHVLEHLDEPEVVFRWAAGIVEKKGSLWIAVPSDRRPSRRFSDVDLLDQPPHHMTRWTKEAFAAIAARNGWGVAEVTYEPLTLRTALWSVSVASPQYKAAKQAGRFKNRSVERLARLTMLPWALKERLTKYRDLSGFSVLARFVSAD